MTTHKLISGLPFARIETLIEEIGKSGQTVKKRLRKIEEMQKTSSKDPTGRYPKGSVRRFNGILQGCDYPVWYDYMAYHDILAEKNLDHPPYDPYEIAKRLGWYKEEAV